ncbi:Phenylacetate--CoA ligase [Thermodesulfobium narugense DSM 14796]|uniref:Phenylacetate-coenzyme A ligase n=1 Tax=Thermodesulfobium narugense DSM 14796 TaxID=747365 RepID=M1E8K2_9BACT|nr:phenylacetate--CoA ligase [Thermodesulfobium narugense]AEE15213.1 Phenylacetate--CoA ligase [Thermodesulfobium narugense DSM 14796]
MRVEEKEKSVESLEFENIKSFLKNIAENSPFYRKKFREIGFEVNDFKSMDDFSKLPFTTKEDLRDAYPLGMLACPEEKIVRIHSSSGTTGKPVIIPYTQKDIDDWKIMMKRCYEIAGVKPTDRVQITPGYGLWTAGIGFQLGAELLGAMTIPTGPGNTDRQIEMMLNLKSTVLTSTSSYALLLGEEIERRGLREDISLRIGIIGSERWGDRMRKRIEELLNIESFDIYGLTEIYGPGIGLDCKYHNGIHVFDDFMYFEVIDPDTLEVLPDGARGELVITTFKKEGAPLLRFRTRDITSINHELCECGLKYPRIERLTGRSDDMFKIKGVNCFPAQIEIVLREFDELFSEYQIILDRFEGKDRAILKVECSEPDNTNLSKKISRRIKDRVGATFDVELLTFGALPRSEKKTKRVFDLRDEV